MNQEKWSTPFEGLKKALKARNKKLRKSPPPPTQEPPGTPEDDEACFMEAMKDVSEISDFRQLSVSVPKLQAVKPSRPSESDEASEAYQELQRIVSRKSGITLADTDEYMEWAAPSLPLHRRRELTRSLHEGVYSISDFIDLHCLTEDEAWEEISDFLVRARKRKLACVKVIHGRGLRSPREPVLKGAVKRWLKGPLSKYVTAYATARACDGGLGATYVLLKR